MRRFLPALLLAACAQAPLPLDEPGQDLVVQHTREAWLANLIGSPPAATPAGAATQLRVAAFAWRGPLPGAPLQDQATLIVANRGEPFRGAAPSLAGIMVLHGEAAQTWAAGITTAPPTRLQALGAATAVVAAGFGTSIEVPGNTLHLQAALVGDALHLAFGSATGELVLWSQALTTREPGAVVFAPARAADQPALALLLQRGSADAAAIAATLATIEALPAPAVDRQPPGPLSIQRQLDVARAAVGARNRRPALLALAQSLQLQYAADLLLGADEPLLVAITSNLPASAADAPPPSAWLVERAVWNALLPALQRDALPLALRATLIRHLGALLFDPGSLDLLLQTSTDAPEFASGLRDANLAALADHDTAPRVRAHDWLVHHGGTVPDYEPLAPRDDRQRALRRFAEAAAAADPGTSPTEGGR